MFLTWLCFSSSVRFLVVLFYFIIFYTNFSWSLCVLYVPIITQGFATNTVMNTIYSTRPNVVFCHVSNRRRGGNTKTAVNMEPALLLRARTCQSYYITSRQTIDSVDSRFCVVMLILKLFIFRRYLKFPCVGIPAYHSGIPYFRYFSCPSLTLWCRKWALCGNLSCVGNHRVREMFLGYLPMWQCC